MMMMMRKIITISKYRLITTVEDILSMVQLKD